LLDGLSVTGFQTMLLEPLGSASDSLENKTHCQRI